MIETHLAMSYQFSTCWWGDWAGCDIGCGEELGTWPGLCDGPIWCGWWDDCCWCWGCPAWICGGGGGCCCWLYGIDADECGVCTPGLELIAVVGGHGLCASPY